MANPAAKKQAPSQQTRDEAMKIAKATQRPGPNKEQTRLIAQGIQKGIDLYKKQQKVKARELDKKLKQVSRQTSVPHDVKSEPEIQEVVHDQQNWLPWVLLAVSWAVFGVIFITG